ncbi:MAG TPA: MBL fold metallo-hydrolase [Actinomycetota bacterium]
MTAFICATCGVQHPDTETPPERCAICDDERQYPGPDGQLWTTLGELGREHRNSVREVDAGLVEIHTDPRFGIGQRALLVRTPAGNVLWDCISLFDDETAAAVRDAGGLAAVTCSHPHFYASMVEWALAFDAEILVPEADREWVMRPDPSIRLWSGTEEIVSGVTVVQTGGHFEGSAILHWADGADGRGAILTGDSITVVTDHRWVSFMRSYPNAIPLPAPAIAGIVDAVEPWAFDRIYGGWPDADVATDAKDSVRRSAERYLKWIGAG